jgi:hypothetical protein
MGAHCNREHAVVKRQEAFLRFRAACALRPNGHRQVPKKHEKLGEFGYPLTGIAKKQQKNERTQFFCGMLAPTRIPVFLASSPVVRALASFLVPE